jgi:hypothetical protein
VVTPPRRVALASCDPFPPVADDEGALVRALARRGVEVVTPAWDAGFDWAGCDLVLLRTTWDYQTRAAAFMAWCERVAALTRLEHPLPVVRWNIDKRYLAALAGQGVRIADTTWLLPGDPPPAHLPARGFVKPIVGANAFATLRLGPDDHAALAAHRAAHPDLGFMLQPYLATVEDEGELSAIVIAGRYTHGVRKVPAAGDYRVQEDWGAADHAHDFSAGERALVESIVATAEALVGARLVYARADFLRAPDGGLVLNELEVIEPCLFFRHGPDSAERLAAALLGC